MGLPVIHCAGCRRGEMAIWYVDGCFCRCHLGQKQRPSFHDRLEALRKRIEGEVRSAQAKQEEEA